MVCCFFFFIVNLRNMFAFENIRSCTLFCGLLVPSVSFVADTFLSYKSLPRTYKQNLTCSVLQG